ncbi:MAG TPA: PqqD family protein [Caulobacteraceae bacterium]
MRVRCASWISWGPGGSAITLFDDRDGSYHALNASASRIWTALGEGRQPEEIGAAIAAAHQRPLAEVQRDIDEFVALALAKGLLVTE